MKRGIALMTMTALLGMSVPFVFAASQPAAASVSNADAVMLKPATIWIVKSGDTLWEISQSTGVPIAQITLYNGITNANLINVGQGLRIPNIWTVKPGDTLWKIALAKEVSVQSIAKVNGITNVNQIEPGSTLIIPTTTATYTVQPGGTLWKIALAAGVSLQALVQANHLSNPDNLAAGQVLTILLPALLLPLTLFGGDYPTAK